MQSAPILSLETNRLLLRTMRAEDVDDLLRVFSGPKVMAAFGGQVYDRGQMAHWVQRNLAHQSTYGYGLFSVIHKHSGELIGDCGLEHMEFEGRDVAELGYDLRSDSWGQGLATEAAMAVCDYAFGTLQLPQLISLIRQGNVRSRRVAEKVGMQHLADVERYGHGYWVYGLSRPAAGSS